MKFITVIPFLLLLNVVQLWETNADVVELPMDGAVGKVIPAHHRRSEEMMEQLETIALQTFYIPFPETNMMADFFVPINRTVARGYVRSIISVSISTDNTVIWYDHWEDGYDLDSSNITKRSSTTEVWGDGNATNGCQPMIGSVIGTNKCTDAADVLNAGMSFVIENNVVVTPRNKAVIRWDGGDKVITSFPIAITRAGYPEKPGSLLAGAVEVLDTTAWGTSFVSPVGTDTPKAAWEFTAFVFMAKEPNTTVEIRRNTNTTAARFNTWVLNEGESRIVRTNISQTLLSNKPIQVDLITGDIDSVYESRWFSLRDLPQWTTEYVTPTGETIGKTKLVIYNPHRTLTATVTLTTLNATTGNNRTQSFVVPRLIYYLTNTYILDGTGGQVKSDLPVFVMSITDSETTTTLGERSGGSVYDWGFPVQPLTDLTSQVLVAWGYGCTDNDCKGEAPRNVVWITPVADADVYVDYKNQGSNQTVYRNTKRLQCLKLTDPSDKDMSGAMIFATKPGTGVGGAPVNIAASWGQDPLVSRLNQPISLDLGTTVLPFYNVRVAKVVDKEFVSPGESLIYTIRIFNLGQSRIVGNSIRLKDTLDTWVDYVPGTSTVALVNTTVPFVQRLQDSLTGTPFPLDGTGALIALAVPPRGGMLDISFEVKLKSAAEIKVNITTIVNNGVLEGPATLPFDAISYVRYVPNITLTNTVYLGSDSAGASCPSAVEYVETFFANDDVVYCFNITNNGQTYLNNLSLNDTALGIYRTGIIPSLAPGASILVPVKSKIVANLTNSAIVIGNPSFANGTDIANLSDVNATDPSEVALLPLLPNITLTNTVYLGSDSAGASCGTAVEYVEGASSTDVVYCFNITNNGNTHLSSITLNNADLGFIKSDIPMLAPGESLLVPFVSSILANLTNDAVVIGNPVLANGTDIPTLPNVTATDPSAVGLLVPTIGLTNTVYLGSDITGSSCGTAVEFVSGAANTDVVYCFNITNTGRVHLSNITLTDGALSFTKSDIIAILAPGESVLVPFVSKIFTNLTNDAVVVGNPVRIDGSDIASLADVTATDPSAVGVLVPSIALTNTVYLGSDITGSSCGTAVEFVSGVVNTDVVYCFNITNTGFVPLSNITLTDGALSFTKSDIISILEPGQSVLVPFVSKILTNLTNDAVVVGNPVRLDGSDIANFDDVTATDPSAVGLLAPSIDLTNTVYLGSDIAGESCGTAVEYVEGIANTDVVYCFNITNTGNTYLSNITLTDGALTYTKSDIGLLAPGQSVLVPFVSMIFANLTNDAVVVGNPVLADGTDIANAEDVTDTDPSAVGMYAPSANITVTNTVYIGTDSAGSECSEAVELVEGYIHTGVVYCFNITNTGLTYLSNITLSDSALTFTKTGIVSLAPGQSVLVPYVSTITMSLSNEVIVVGNPVNLDGSDIISLSDVTARDPSAVALLENWEPPGNNTCLTDSWNDTYTFPYPDVTCTTKEVYVEELISKPIKCVLGTRVNVSVSAKISLASSRSDLGWFIAADGGDGLDGNCLVEGLDELYVYKITNTSFGGEITWHEDECGDVSINGTGAILEVPVFVHGSVMCADDNKDGKVDLSVCFTWNTGDTDGLCTLNSPQSGGKPNLYPGGNSMCYCESYNIDNSTVVDPTDDPVPCS